MRVMLIKQEQIYELELPSKILWNYSLDDKDSNGNQRTLIEIVAKNGKWEAICDLDIMFLTNDNKLIETQTKNDEFNTDFISYDSIKEVEKQLIDKNFSRCHQGFLVNFDYIKVFQDSTVVLENGEKLPISRNRKEAFGEEYMTYCWDREEAVEVWVLYQSFWKLF